PATSRPSRYLFIESSNSRQSDAKLNINGVRKNIKTLKMETRGMKENVKGLKASIRDVMSIINLQRTDFAYLKAKVEENGSSLKSLGNKPEVDRLLFFIAGLVVVT